LGTEERSDDKWIKKSENLLRRWPEEIGKNFNHQVDKNDNINYYLHHLPKSARKKNTFIFLLLDAPFPVCPPALPVVPVPLDRAPSGWTPGQVDEGRRPRCRRVERS